LDGNSLSPLSSFSSKTILLFLYITAKNSLSIRIELLSWLL
jgi:hypothetical protein